MTEKEFYLSTGASVYSFGEFSLENLRDSFSYDPLFNGETIGNAMNYFLSCFIGKDSCRTWYIENGELILVIPNLVGAN